MTYRRDGRELHVAARRDVILSAGALHTPQLLQVSGIGPGALLQKHGIAVVHDLPGVGENLMDHVQYGAKFRTTSPHTFNKQVGSILMQGLQGISALPAAAQRAAEHRCLAGRCFLPHPARTARTRHPVALPPVHAGGQGLGPGRLLRFPSRHVPGAPLIRAAMPGSPAVASTTSRTSSSTISRTRRMLAVAVAGMRAAMKVGAAMPSEFGIEQIDPGPNLSNDELLAWIKENSGTAFHFAGTARMGTDDMSVVDPTTMRVHGVDGLRVVDASVMPGEVTANIHPAVIAIAGASCRPDQEESLIAGWNASRGRPN